MPLKVLLLDLIKPHPDNPRTISQSDFDLLKRSLERDPEIMTVNPIVLNSKKDFTILAGEQRYKALLSIGMKKIPISWVVFADSLTEEQKRKFVILDNYHSGSWDIEKLEADWGINTLSEWEINIPELSLHDEKTGQDPFSDSGIESKNQYGVIVMCENEQRQREAFESLTESGYNCKIVVT